MKNEFLLHLKSSDIEKLDALFLNLISDKTFDAEIVSRKVFEKEKKIAYWIKISAACLILLKKKLDELTTYESLQLFEYKDW
jgi:hypothetical protein